MDMPYDVGAVLDRGLDADPHRTAVITRSGSLTYEQLDGRANRAARALSDLGVRSGDRLAVCLPNDTEILVAFHGAMRLGAVWVGINQALATPEKCFILRDSGASAALVDSETASALFPEMDALPDLRTLITVEEGEGAAPNGGWRAAADAQSSDPLSSRVDPNAPAAITYTSGTTGFPKGVLLSQTNLLLPGAYLVATRRYDSELRKADCFPLTILNMLILTTLLTSQAGGTAVIIDSLNAHDIARWVRDERATVWNGPPPVLYTMAHDETISPSDFASLTEVWSGGADFPEPVRDAFQAKFSTRVYATYGLTEMPTMVCIETLADQHLPGASGKPLPHVEVSIRDDAGGSLSAGEVGEICVRARPQADIRESMRADWGVDTDGEPPSYRPMLGYWHKPDESEEVLRGGVLHTGDAGSLDAAGNLTISDRMNLVLNRGGANVYPAEVERVALRFESVSACAVVGLPDERLGQRIGILVEFKSGVDPDIHGLIARCRDELAQYKVPEFAAAVENLPRNAMGKLDRRALADIGQRTLVGTARIR